MTFIHFSASAFMNSPNCSGEPVIGSYRFGTRNFSLKEASRRIRCTSALILATISGGVPLGATSPNQDAASKPGNPLSATVGSRGNSATRALLPIASARTYDLAKASVSRMAFALAHELRPYGATAVSLTPGWLRSEAMLEAYGVTEANWRDATKRSPHFAISEAPAFVGRAVVALAQDPDVSRWNGQSLSSGQLAKIYRFTDLDGSQPDAWRYVTEAQDAGKPADVTGYR
jgi:NAD(P)-dependent dehydrogenase (short-subunit alcohol dehydrogenase family)